MFRTKEIKIKKSLSLRLKKINSGYSDNKSMIKSMLEEYESDEEGLWEEFEIRFRDIHEEFYNSLIERFPELTKSEIRLCTLLRLDLNTKEIANMLDKSTASIEVYRAKSVPAIKLGNSSEVDKPVHLYCFMESTWSICWHPSANLCNL